jgi:signal peptidase I
MDAETQRDAVCSELVDCVARRRGEVRLKVTGSSMLPVIWPGDEITVTRSEYAELQPGRIILYRRNGGLTAHRIERVAQDQLITRGDSLLYSDSPVRPDEIVGQVVSILRGGHSIPLQRPLVSYICSEILRRSDLLRRLVLHVIPYFAHLHDRSLSHSGDRQATWLNS